MDKRFLKILYNNNNVSDMLQEYCSELLNIGNQLERLKAKRLLDYWALLGDSQFFEKRMKSFFNSFYGKMENKFSQINYEVSGRIKGLFSTLNKAEEIEETVLSQLQEEFINLKSASKAENERIPYIDSVNESLNSDLPNFFKEVFREFIDNYNFEVNPFERIRDFFAFRIILEDEGCGDMLEELYDVANFTLKFLEQSQFEILPATPLRNIGNLEEDVDSSIIFIPKESKILPEYKSNVKDYAFQPKVRGYQSVQFVIRDIFTQRKFECQVRTRSMDIVADTIASHASHKMQRYGKQQEEIHELVDLSQIHVKGFRCFKYIDSNGKDRIYISDKAGITDAIPVSMSDNFIL